MSTAAGPSRQNSAMHGSGSAIRSQGQGPGSGAPTSTMSSAAGDQPPPDASGPDFGVLKELGKAALVEVLNDIPGAKTLVLDSALAGPLGLVVDVASLKHHGVDKMFWLEPGPLSAPTRNVVYLTRPRRSHILLIAQQVRANPGLNYHVLCVPRSTELVRRVLEDEGVVGDIELGQFKLELIPVEADVLSMELDDVARDVFLRGDETPIFYSALALSTLQRAVGRIDRVIAKGDAAKKLASLVERHRPQVEPSESIDSMVIIDRAVDWVTPMCTQLTYEGMLDEFVGISHSHIEVDAQLLDPDAPPKKRKHQLSSADPVYAGIRDLNFALVGQHLSRLARRLEGEYGGVKNLQSVSQMKDFVGRIGGLQSEQQALRLHTALAERLLPVTRSATFNQTLEAQQNLLAGYDAAAQWALVEDLLAQQAPVWSVLRVAVLYSLTSGGVKPKVLEGFKRDFLQTYGYQHLPLLVALGRLGLLSRAPAGTSFGAARKALRLLVDDVDDADPDDIAYVYSGYAPLSVRLVQAAAQRSLLADSGGKEGWFGGHERQRPPRTVPRDVVRMEGKRAPPGWRGMEDVVNAVPGASYDKGPSGAAAPSTGTTLVFFLGGCTSTEISALRWMSALGGRRFVVGTTGVVNGSSLLESFGDPRPVPLN